MLTLRQRNELFRRLGKIGISPVDCDLEIGDLARVIHLPTGSCFSFKDFGTQWMTWWYVADGPDDDDQGAQCWRWRDVLKRLRDWADEVKYVAEAPDLWSELQQVPEIMAAAQSADASNAPFSHGEQADVSRRLDQAREVLRQGYPELTDEQMSAIEETLDEVKEASTRVGRKDWVMMANGALLSLIVNDLIPPHVVQTIFSILITGIGHIFGVGGPPPVIDP